MVGGQIGESFKEKTQLQVWKENGNVYEEPNRQLLHINSSSHHLPIHGLDTDSAVNQLTHEAS
jgi:hypothetical protein